MTKQIKLTRGYVSLVDDEDYEYLNQWKWHYSYGYAVRNVWEGESCVSIRMHRIARNTPDGLDTDHINRDKLDNRKENLRICTRSQNLSNKTRNKNNKSGYKGVYFHAISGKWKAQVRINRISNHLGTFSTPEEAALEYNKKAFELFGEFAVLNEVSI